MKRPDLLESFVAMSQLLGANPAFVQGGGGNTSVKMDAKRMHVKASGLTLSQISNQSGFVTVNFLKIRKYLPTASENEEAFTEAIHSTVMEAELLPSLETGFHAVLKPVVAHTHSVYLNVLACAQEGKSIAHDLLPNTVWIPYCSPGRALTLAIAERPDHSVFLLQNHGVIVNASSAQEVLNIHDEINNSVRTALGLDVDFVAESAPAFELKHMREHILFPDQVIFTDPESGLLGSRAAKETIAAYGYILKEIERAKLTPNYLQQADGDFLVNMEMEKYRRSVAT